MVPSHAGLVPSHAGRDALSSVDGPDDAEIVVVRAASMVVGGSFVEAVVFCQ
jgi:hypothetical protein